MSTQSDQPGRKQAAPCCDPSTATVPCEDDYCRDDPHRHIVCAAHARRVAS